jgi:hypothetical protein
MPADNLGRSDQDAGQAGGYYKHEQKRAVVIEVIGVHFSRAAIIAFERTSVNELSNYFSVPLRVLPRRLPAGKRQLPMSSGFNTDVQMGDKVFHVQTEDRGPANPLIDTTVYQNGRVVLRRASNYAHYAASVEFDAQELHERVEEHHRALIEDLRTGLLDAEMTAAAKEEAGSGGIQVQLLNPEAWVSEGNVSLDLQILRRADRQPEGGARAEAFIEGALQEGHHEGTSDSQGRVRIEFPMPPLGKGDLALVIRARNDTGKDEIRFAMRSRAKVPSGGAPE